MAALSPPLSPKHEQIEGTKKKKTRYNQVYHKKIKYKNN